MAVTLGGDLSHAFQRYMQNILWRAGAVRSLRMPAPMWSSGKRDRKVGNTIWNDVFPSHSVDVVEPAVRSVA